MHSTVAETWLHSVDLQTDDSVVTSSFTRFYWKFSAWDQKASLVTRLELYQDGLSFYFKCNYSPSLHHTLSNFTIFQWLVSQCKSVLFVQTTSNQSSQEVFGAAPYLWQGQSSGTKQLQIDIFPQWSNFTRRLPTSLLACGVEAFK